MRIKKPALFAASGALGAAGIASMLLMGGQDKAPDLSNYPIVPAANTYDEVQPDGQTVVQRHTADTLTVAVPAAPNAQAIADTCRAHGPEGERLKTAFTPAIPDVGACIEDLTQGKPHTPRQVRIRLGPTGN